MEKFFLFLMTFLLVSCNGQEQKPISHKSKKMNTDKNNLEYIVFGGGCFWCVESCFNMLNGVEKAVSGYSGGHTKNPTYKEVCTGETGHAEVIQITFDPKIISFDEILEVFFETHDPTSLNRQGADAGTQYRSVIFYHDTLQKQKAEVRK